MSYITNPSIQKTLIGSEVVGLGGLVTVVMVALNVYLYSFTLDVPTTFSGVKYRTGSTATGSADAGIYSFAGTLLATIGGLANVASTSVNQAFSGGTITLGPGQYFAAFTSQNATDTYEGITATNNAVTIQSLYRQATNPSTVPVSVVVLPNATGGFVNMTSAKLPGFSLTVVGGI